MSKTQQGPQLTPARGPETHVFNLVHSGKFKRFAFQGDISPVRVYNAVNERVAQYFKLDPSSFTLTLCCTSGPALVHIKDHASYLAAVSPQNHPANSIKRDLKGRIVHKLFVNVKASQETAATSRKGDQVSRGNLAALGRDRQSPKVKERILAVQEKMRRAGQKVDDEQHISSDERQKAKSTSVGLFITRVESLVGNTPSPSTVEHLAPAVPTTITGTAATTSTTPVAILSGTDLLSSVKSAITSFVDTFNTHLSEQLGQEACSMRIAFEEHLERESAARREIADAKKRNEREDKVAEKLMLGGRFYCDHCLNSIPADRPHYRCTTCPDYDLDPACYELFLLSITAHPDHHSFELSGGPSNYAAAVDSLHGSIVDVDEKEKQQELPSSSRIVIESEESHSASCNTCLLPIRGIRYKSLIFTDYDLCGTCLAKRGPKFFIHFLAIPSPSSAPSSPLATATPAVVDDAIISSVSTAIINKDPQQCSICDTAFVFGRSQTQYRCIVKECETLVMCDECESKDSHRIEGHWLLKICNEPVPSDETLSTNLSRARELKEEVKGIEGGRRMEEPRKEIRLDAQQIHLPGMDDVMRIAAGTAYQRTLVIRNAGNIDWPQSTVLLRYTPEESDSLDRDQSLGIHQRLLHVEDVRGESNAVRGLNATLAGKKPGETTQITIDERAGEEDASSLWRLKTAADEDGEWFGSVYVLSYKVESEEETLSTSITTSFVAPSPNTISTAPTPTGTRSTAASLGGTLDGGHGNAGGSDHAAHTEDSFFGELDEAGDRFDGSSQGGSSEQGSWSSEGEDDDFEFVGRESSV